MKCDKKLFEMKNLAILWTENGSNYGIPRNSILN